MRILFTNTGSWSTGAGSLIDGVATEFTRLGHKVHVLFQDFSPIPSPDKEKYYNNPELYNIIKFPLRYNGEEFKTYPLMISEPNPRNLSHAWTYKEMSTAQFGRYIDFLGERLAKVIAEFKPDIIETEHIWLMGYVLSELGCKYVAVAHHTDQMGFRFDKRMRSYAKRCADTAMQIIAISDVVKKDVQTLYNMPSEKITVILNGYDQKIFRPVKVLSKELFGDYGFNDVDHTLPIVTFEGELSKTKGIDILLKANAALQSEVPYVLVIFGSGNIKDALGRAPKPEEMKNVYIVGHESQEELARFNNAARFSVVPSRQEGFSTAALKAMGCGLPVVGTKIGGLEKFVVGKIVSPGNAEELTKGMKALLKMPEPKLKELKKRALKTAKAYTWKSNVNARLKCYKDALSEEQ